MLGCNINDLNSYDTYNSHLDKSAIPSYCFDFIEVFNERNCDILLPHREYDCEIGLKR